MERTRHRKSKSASGIEGIRQTQKQKAVSRLSSDSRSYTDGSYRDDMFMLELGQSSSGRASGIPMKKLLAEEMSKEVESKRRMPSVIARLMGLEGMPSPRHVHQRQKRFADSYQQKNVSANLRQNNQLYNCQLNKRSSVDQQEFKDVYEDLEASHIVNRRCSSRWTASSILSEPEMALIRRKFMDAKRLSTDEKLQDSKELDDTLEMLASNKDLLLKFLQQPDSLFSKHLHDRQIDSRGSVGSHIAVLKPSNSENFESKSKAWRSERDTSSKRHATYHLKREDGLLLEPHNRHRTHLSHHSSRIQLEEKHEENILPTRIVVLKPDIGKMCNDGAAGLSSNLSLGYPPSYKKIKQFESVGGADTVSWTTKDSFLDGVFQKPISKEAREIAREITMRMRNGCHETENIDKSTIGFKGYVGDESSYDANESDSESESEVFKLSSRKTFIDNNLCRCPSSRLCESSVNREAKKRLSERWKTTHKYQEMLSKGSTLGEMLSLPDGETRPFQLNAKTSLDWPSNQLANNNRSAMWDGPLGISSRDGWKDDISRNSSRSKSLPPSTGGRSHRRSPCHDDLADHKTVLHDDSVHSVRSKVVKENLSHEKCSSKDSKSRIKKPHPCQYVLFNEMHPSSEANFENQMEANTKDVSEQQSMFQMAAKDNICRSLVTDAGTISETRSPTLSSKSSELLLMQSPSVIDADKSAVHDQESSSLQEPKDGPPKQSSSLNCVGAEPDSSESSREVDHPSPVSVLEVPLTEDASSSESFERVGAELQELRMQLQLLKMESGMYAEASTLVPIEEEVSQLSPIVSEGNPVPGAGGWETSYVIDMLIDSGLEESDFNMFRTTPDCPLDPKLFDNLEKKYSDETTGLRSERRLLFDTIKSAVSEVFHEHIDLCPWVKPKSPRWNLKRKEGVRDALEKLINQDFANGEMSDRILDREMRWSDAKGEIDLVGSEIEKLLVDDMIAEVVCN